MLTPRRLIIAAVAIIILVALLRSTSSSTTEDLVAGTSHRFDSENTTPRSYPPRSKQKKLQSNQLTVQDISSKPLREKLRFYFPYDIEPKFPSFIWQTWKTNPSSRAFEERLRPKEASWTEKHPGFVHEVIVDDAAEHLVKYLYSGTPEVAQAYMALPLPVLKADFFRYLILLARGGIYTDIDTTALQSAVNWLPESFDHSTAGLIIGIEADPDRDDWQDWYARRIQFCQWTIQAKPGHPVLRELVASITERVLQMQARKELVQGKLPKTITVMDLTGPGVWTDTVFQYFNSKEFFDTSSHASNISAKDFFGITEHKRVGDVVVLPITSFSPGVGQMGAGETDDPMAFVHHEFDGSWKPKSEQIHN